MKKRIRRKEIGLAPDEEKEKIYQQIDELHKAGNEVKVNEHKSGFPAVTVDCGDIHILTDCLSLEQWHRQKKQAEAAVPTVEALNDEKGYKD
jgi:hypothetical protein